jgi:hypothetical protein
MWPEGVANEAAPFGVLLPSLIVVS